MHWCCSASAEDPTDVSKIYKKVELNYIKSRAQSGDLMCTSGAGKWSDMVRYFSDQPTWSHVGVYVIRPDGQLCILDVDTNGSKLLTFDDYIKQYTGYYIALRPLRDVDEETRKRYQNNIMEYWDEIKFVDYNKAWVLYKSIHRTNVEDSETTFNMFCTQLVIEVYRRMGIIDADTELSNNSQLNDFINPDGKLKHFTKEKIFERRIYVADL